MLAVSDPSWISLLDSEGLLWERRADRFDSRSVPAVVIVPAGSSFRELRAVTPLIRDGTAAIVEPRVAFGAGLRDARTWSFPYEPTRLRGVSETHDAARVEVVRFRLGRGVVYSLPFRLRDVWSDYHTGRQYVQIGSGPDQPLHERMAAVVKKNVRCVVKEVLKRAFHDAGLPFVRKWYWPDGKRTFFCLRGDADGGPSGNLVRFLEVVKDSAGCTSVFFCTSRYATKKDLIAATARHGIEVGSHNHWHIVFPEPFTNSLSVRRAERILSSVAGKPRGFVAPAYFWHPSLYRTLQARGYAYASAFGVSHDDWPFRPVVDGRIADLRRFRRIASATALSGLESTSIRRPPRSSSSGLFVRSTPPASRFTCMAIRTYLSGWGQRLDWCAMLLKRPSLTAISGPLSSTKWPTGGIGVVVRLWRAGMM